MATKTYMCAGPVKHGTTKDDQKTYGVGEEIKLDAAAAKPLLADGAITTKADWQAKRDAPAAAAEATARAAELAVEVEANKCRIAELEAQVGALTEKLDAKAG